MNIKYILIPIFMFCLLFSVFCQTNNDKMPIINSDNSVTFIISAPTAYKVEIDGDMITSKYKIRTRVATIGSKTKKRMNKSGDFWTYTTQALPSDMYTYKIIVDGKPIVDPNNSNIVRDIADTLNYFIIDGGIGDFYKVRNTPHGVITKVWYPSSIQQWDKRRMSVYTPPFYSPNKKRYPVLYLLHGSGGDENSWIDMGRISQILDNMISKNIITPMIVVMPNGNVQLDAAPGEGIDKSTEPTASNIGSMFGIMEATFINDIVNYIDRNYSTIASKKGRAIAGLSLGGLHTLYISLNNPTTFNYIGLFSAQTTNALTNNRINTIKSIKKIFNEIKSNFAIFNSGYFNKNTDNLNKVFNDQYMEVYNNVDEKIDNLFISEPALFYIALGEEDFVKKLNDDLRKKLDNKGYKYEYHETKGAHTWDNWRKYIVDFLPRLFPYEQ